MGAATANIILIGTNDASTGTPPPTHATGNIILIGTNDISNPVQPLAQASNHLALTGVKVTPTEAAPPVHLSVHLPTHLPAFSHDFLIVLVLVVVCCILLYFCTCYCAKVICEKCGVKPGLLIWIPILGIIPLLQAGGMSRWLFLLFFIPVVDLVMVAVIWAKICQALGRSPWLAILMFIPIVQLVFPAYLAFSDP